MYLDQRYIQSVCLNQEILSKVGYPYNVPSINYLKHLEFDPNVTFLIGENGSGKSTLLEAIAVNLGFNPEGGSKNFNFNTSDNQRYASDALDIKKGIRRPRDNYFLRAESFYNVASNIEELDREAERYGGYGVPIQTFFGGKSLHEQSHGESFFTLIDKRFTGKGLYLLDEPEAALSPMKQMAMISRIHDLCNDQSQFIIATHSPIILSYPHSTIYQVNEKGIEEVTYEDSDVYNVTRNFLNRPNKMLEILLD